MESKQRFQRDFLVFTVLGPFLIYIAVALVFNTKLLSTWGSHLWMLFGLLLLFCLQTQPTRLKIRAVLVRCVAFGAVFVVADVIQTISTPYVLGVPLRTHYPSSAIAAEVHKRWEQRYDQPLLIVGGDWWLASLASLGGPHRLRIYGGSDINWLDMGLKCSGWITDDELAKCGGVLVWDVSQSGGKRPAILASRFPAAEFLEPVSIPWLTSAKIPPLQLGLAIVPPGEKGVKKE